jgi:hypothetical protein
MMGRVVLLEGADLLDREPHDGRTVRPWLVFIVLGALALAGLAYVVVRAIPKNPQVVRDPLQPSRLSGQPYSVDPVTRISDAQAEGMTSEAWRLAGINGVPHSLQITFVVGGGCETPVGILVHETRAAVTIEAVSHTDRTSSACASVGRTGAGSVILKRQLGNRALFHAPVGREQAGAAGLLTA